MTVVPQGAGNLERQRQEANPSKHVLKIHQRPELFSWKSKGWKVTTSKNPQALSGTFFTSIIRPFFQRPYFLEVGWHWGGVVPYDFSEKSTQKKNSRWKHPPGKGQTSTNKTPICTSWWLVEPTPLERYESNWIISSKIGVKMKNIWKHRKFSFTCCFPCRTLSHGTVAVFLFGRRHQSLNL